MASLWAHQPRHVTWRGRPTWGIPVAARVIAFGLPARANAIIGSESQPTIERLLGLRPSALTSERQAALRAQFARLVGEIGSTD